MSRLQQKVILLQTELKEKEYALEEAEIGIGALREYNEKLELEVASDSAGLSYLLNETQRFSFMIDDLIEEKWRLDMLLTDLEGEYALLASRVNASVSAMARRIEPKGDGRWTLLAVIVVLLFIVVFGSGFIYPKPKGPREGFFH
jgi:hypothetical protein